MKKLILSFFLIGLLISSCRKDLENPSWDTQLLAPLVNASLDINNILPDSILQANADSSMKIVYNSDIYNLSMDTLFQIPDTIIKNGYNIPLSTTLTPGQTVINNAITETT